MFNGFERSASTEASPKRKLQTLPGDTTFRELERSYSSTMQKLAPPSGSNQQAINGDRPRSSDRVLQVLKTVAAAPEGVTLTEIARTVDLAASTALRQLRSLEASGLVDRGIDQAYRPGSDLVRLAHQVLATSTLVDRAQPLLETVAARSGESAYLARPEDTGFCVYVAAAPGSHQLRHSGWLGRQIPLAGTAVGAALTDNLDETGSAFRRDGHEPGVSAVSAPVFDRVGVVVAAVSAVGPTFRMIGAQLDVARVAVLEAATALSRSMGY